MYTNKLISEKSPYLLQHAHNPVNWYPWGDEAFNKAKKDNKPIFLSIGYSTCHWCHVMEHESFENEETADILNKHFISIKIDREERPDIDAVYMSVCTSMTGSGGWPMTIIMTPDQKPFYAATYLPKLSRYGLIGLDELLLKINDMWNNDKNRLLKSADKITDFIHKENANIALITSSAEDIINNGVNIFKKTFDIKYGGFGSAPKFPIPHNLFFLMQYSILNNDNYTLEITLKTLTQMYRGGIFDHIGGGFSRYSTDEKWLVPHFEKMLYDNSLLIYAYIKAFSITKNPLFKQIAEKTITYVMRELTDTNGGFFCGQDADSEGIEGKYYVFSPYEIKSVLGETDGEIFCKTFDITSFGNFEGNSIPNLLNNDNFKKINTNINLICKKIYNYRLNRTKLHKDDKILTSWNALMIASLAKAYKVTGNLDYLKSAKKTCNFIENNLVDSNNRLMVRWRDGESKGEGKIDDYAFYSLALVEMYGACFDVKYLKRACEVARIMCDRFFDEEVGGFFLYADDGEKLISRPKEIYDGAIPSGNSVAAYVLNKLFSLTIDSYWHKKSDKQNQYILSNISGYPAGYSFSLLAMQNKLFPCDTLVCVSNEDNIENKILKFQRENKKYEIDIIVKTIKNKNTLSGIASFTSQYKIPTKGTMYYYCKNGVCFAPVDDLSKIYN